MSYVLHRNLRKTPLHAARGAGSFLVDADGKRYLDASGGAAVSCLGHSHPALIDAIQEQVAKLPYAHTSFFTTDVLEDLAEILVTGAPGMGKVLLLSGGSEAVEAALKLSRQYHLAAGKPDKKLYIARRQSYHGNTLGALAVGGNEWRREPFRPLLVAGHHIAPCFEYREREAAETTEDYAARAAAELDDKIAELGADNVAAFVAETVVGATAGAVVAVPGYFSRIREICDRHGVHLILDEVMCGTGRTGTMMAYEQEEIEPDIVTMAKGLAAGYQPIGALLCRKEITDTIETDSGFFQHGHTFMGHATAVAAALAAQKVIQEERLLDSVQRRGAAILEHLRSRLGSHPNVGDVRGRGLFIGIEFVTARDSKDPFDPALKLHNQVQLEAMQNGLLCYGMGGTIDGRRGDHILLAPPYNMNDDEQGLLIDTMTTAIERTLPA